MSTTEIIWVSFYGFVALIALVIIVMLVVSAFKAKKEEGQTTNAPVINVYIDSNGHIVSATPATSASKEEEPVKAEEPAPAPVSEPVIVEAPSVPAGVAFKRESKTFEEQLAAAPKDIQKLLKKFYAHIEELDKTIRVNPSKNRVRIKYRSYYLCEFKFSRGELRGYFFVASQAFKVYSKNGGDVAVKERPSEVVFNAASYEACEHMVDLAYEQAKEAKALKAKGSKE